MPEQIKEDELLDKNPVLSDAEKEIEEPRDLLLARLYDTVIALKDIVEINTIELVNGQKLVSILLKDVQYNVEVGFEEIATNLP